MVPKPFSEFLLQRLQHKYLCFVTSWLNKVAFFAPVLSDAHAFWNAVFSLRLLSNEWQKSGLQ